MSSGATTSAMPAGKRRPWYLTLWIQVLIAMVAGVLLGHFFPQAGTSMQPLGDAFIKMIRMLIAPIIFCTVILGIAKMNDMTRVGRVALKTLIYFEVLTTVALIIGLVMVNLWQPGAGMNISASSLDTGSVKGYIAQTQTQGVVPFLLNIIPGTVVGALTDGNILQVLFLSVIFGATLVALGDYGEPLVNILEIVSRMLFGAVAIVMWAAPLGAFGAIAFTVGKYGAGTLWSLGKLLICFATTSSESVLPRMLTKLEACGCKASVVGLVIPTGYSFNLDGTCLYLAAVTVFLAQATNTPLDLYQQLGLLAVLLLTSKGAAGVAGAAFVVLAATLSTVGTIPVSSVALILGVHRLLSEGLTPTNLIGNAVATIVIAKWEGELDREQLRRALETKPD